MSGGFQVQRRMCKTCIYRPESPLDLERLEEQVRHYVRGRPFGFEGYRVCHHSDDVCCRGFWDAHKDEFALGQIAQRLDAVEFVDVDTLAERKEMNRREYYAEATSTPYGAHPGQAFHQVEVTLTQQASGRWTCEVLEVRGQTRELGVKQTHERHVITGRGQSLDGAVWDALELAREAGLTMALVNEATSSAAADGEAEA